MHRAQGVSVFVVWFTVSYKLIALLHTEKASILSISSKVVTQVSCSLRFSNTSDKIKDNLIYKLSKGGDLLEWVATW